MEEREYTHSDIQDLSYEDIDLIQKERDEKNKEAIDRAEREGLLMKNEAEYLHAYYDDGMESCSDEYTYILNIFNQPESINAFYPETGKVKCDANGKEITYKLKCVTPFVNSRMVFCDKEHNPIYVIIPKMKSVERAIEKIKDEYRRDRVRAMKKSFDRLYESEDREAFSEALQTIPRTTTQLNDILRLTMTFKYLSGVMRFKRIIENKKDYEYINPEVHPDETRNRFNKKIEENPKQYYDVKIVVYVNAPGKPQPRRIEIQLKIDTLHSADIRTHKLYEQIRSLEAQTVERDKSPQAQKRRFQIEQLNQRIAQINRNAIHEYNMLVMEKVRWKYDEKCTFLAKRKSNEDLRQELYDEKGLYKECNDIIKKNFMPESYDSFNATEFFSPDSELNKLCFLRMNGKLSKTFNEFGKNASRIINETFEKLPSSEKERLAEINALTAEYQKTIQARIDYCKKNGMEYKEESKEVKPTGRSGKESR